MDRTYLQVNALRITALSYTNIETYHAVAWELHYIFLINTITRIMILSNYIKDAWKVPELTPPPPVISASHLSCPTWMDPILEGEGGRVSSPLSE